MEKENSQKPYRARQISIMIFSGIGLLLGVVLIMMAIHNLFVWQSADLSLTNTCPDWEPLNFVKKLSIFRVIMLVMASLSILAFLLIILLTLYSALYRGTWEKYQKKIHITYAILISVGILVTLVAFLYSLKIYVFSSQILQSNLIANCVLQDSQNYLGDRRQALLGMLIISALMLVFYIWNTCMLPSKFIIGQKQKNAHQLLLKSKKRVGSFQLSNQEFLPRKAELTSQVLMPTATIRSQHDVGVLTDQNLLVLASPPIMESKGISTDPVPQMKNFKTQVSLSPSVIYEKQEVKQKVQCSQMGVDTKNDLYKVSSLGIMVAPRMSHVSVGETRNLSVSVGVGDQVAIPESSTVRDIVEPYQQTSETTRYEFLQPVKRIAPSSISQQSKKNVDLNEQGYYYLQKSRINSHNQSPRVQHEVEGRFIDPPYVQVPNRSHIRPRSRLIRSQHNKQVIADQNPLDNAPDKDQFGLVLFSYKEIDPREVGNIKYEDTLTPSRKIRYQRIQKIRQKHSSRRRSHSYSTPNRSPIFELIDKGDLEREQRQIFDSAKYKKQMMDQYRFINSLTPHKSRLLRKGIFDQYPQKQNPKKEKYKGESIGCQLLGYDQCCGQYPN